MRVSKYVAVFGLLLYTSCKHVDGFVISGETLNAAGDIFLQTNSAMDAAGLNGQITKDTHAKWEEFAKKFKAVYVTSNQLWHIAILTNDSVLEGKALEAAMTLLPELVKFAQSVGVSIEVLRQ